MEKQRKYYCYIINSINPNFSNSTYNGSTNDLTRRLRQHNGEIVGGAKATRGKGPWKYIAVWEGFQTHKEALSCEWRIKHPTNTKKRPTQYNGVKGRIKSLNLIIGLDCWTGKSSGMETNLEYNLFIQENLIELINLDLKKSNLKIRKISELII
jgi:predicted GIY-YIG superfamily endonuclease